MNTLNSVRYFEYYKIGIKMKRIALLLLALLTLASCKNHRVEPPPPPDPDNPSGKTLIALNIYVPGTSLSTYADEAASAAENYIDSLYIDLYQSNVLINQKKFKRTDQELQVINDSTVRASYEVDNITTGQLKAQVFANWQNPLKITSEIAIPLGTHATSFFMSGEGNIALNAEGTAYVGTVYVKRNVAKLRVKMSKNSIVIPSDLAIDYSNVQIQILHTPDNTTRFENETLTPTYFNYAERGGTNLREASTFNTTTGGQIDSLYLYENRTSVKAEGTQIKITIPTLSPTEGNKTSEYTYTLYTTTTGYAINRNYIYIIDIKVRGQNLDPLITLDLEPWNDVPIDGSILGGYLTTKTSEIVFDENGIASIDFCSDAQAIYFDYSGFNNDPQNMANAIKIGQGEDIEVVGIEDADPNLAPPGYRDGQILLDKQHCGTFKFKLHDDLIAQLPAVNFAGTICVRAGNLVKCFTFPAGNVFDAHYIVGEPILNGETFTSAIASADDNGSWLEVSENRLYINPTTNYSSATPKALYLHLDENLTTSSRTGSITLVNTTTGVEKKFHITQLPALRVGRFGYTADVAVEDNGIYSSDLYMEQLYEYSTMPIYNAANSGVVPSNALYNGRFTALNSSVFNFSLYQTFNYQSATYQAINYCAQKNRIASASAIDINNGLKWYLPAQAQLMGMWISYYGIDSTHTNFNGADIFWSSTDHDSYDLYAHTLNFRYGNVGYYYQNLPYFARCVRDAKPSHTPSSTMVERRVSGTFEYPFVDFSKGMPVNSYTTVSKNNAAARGDDKGVTNRTLYKTLRIAKNDLNISGTLLWTGDEAYTQCGSYSETGATSGWRLPTQRELYAIWILQQELKATVPSFEYLGSGDFNYWSATYASPTYYSNTWTSAWTIDGSFSPAGSSGNAPHQVLTNKNRARCVREEN